MQAARACHRVSPSRRRLFAGHISRVSRARKSRRAARMGATQVWAPAPAHAATRRQAAHATLQLCPATCGRVRAPKASACCRLGASSQPRRRVRTTSRRRGSDSLRCSTAQAGEPGSPAGPSPGRDTPTSVWCVASPASVVSFPKASASATHLPCATTHTRPGALPRTARVGVLGGGQLGRMLAIAAVRVPCVQTPGLASC